MTNTLASSGGAAAALVFESTTFEVVDCNGQQWLKSGQIAQALGYADETAVTKLYARRKDEFTDSMSQTVNLTVQGQMRETRIFSLRGAHLLAMFSRTAIAALFRKWVLDILDKQVSQTIAIPYTKAPGQTLSADQAATLRNMLGDACKQLPKEQQGAFMTKGWAKLKTHFGVSYRQIPVQEFTEAVSLVSRHIVSFNQIDAMPVAQLSIDEVITLRELVQNHGPRETIDATVERWARQLGEGNAYPVSTFLPLWQAVNQRLAQRIESSASRKAVQ